MQSQDPIHSPPPANKPIGFLHPATLLATWFGSGKIKFMPGTMGSLAALPFAYSIHTAAGSQILLIAALVAFLVGVAATEMYMTANNSDHDSSEIVIDEVAGQWLLLSAFAPSWHTYFIGFLIFRFMDIIKPWPISLLDRHVPGAFGVMIDDFAAAALPIVIICFIMFFFMITGQQEEVNMILKFLGHEI